MKAACQRSRCGSEDGTNAELEDDDDDDDDDEEEEEEDEEVGRDEGGLFRCNCCCRCQ